MSHKQTPPKGFTLIIAMLSMIRSFTIDTYLPAFPAIEADYGVGRAMLSQTVALYLATFAIPLLIHHPVYMALGQLTLIIIALVLWRFTPPAERPLPPHKLTANPIPKQCIITTPPYGHIWYIVVTRYPNSSNIRWKNTTRFSKKQINSPRRNARRWWPCIWTITTPAARIR